MNEAVLAEKKIGIVVENKFIPDEIAAYQSGFAILGAESRIADLLFVAVLSWIAGLCRFVHAQGTDIMRPLLNCINTHGVSPKYSRHTP